MCADGLFGALGGAASAANGKPVKEPRDGGVPRVSGDASPTTLVSPDSGTIIPIDVEQDGARHRVFLTNVDPLGRERINDIIRAVKAYSDKITDRAQVF